MSDSLLIKGGRIIDPAQDVDKTADLLIKEGKILWLGEGKPPVDDYAVLEASGLIVCTATCASPVMKPRKPSPPAPGRRRGEALPPFVVCPTPTPRWTTPTC